MGWRGVVLSLCLTPLPAQAEVLTFEIRPGTDPTKDVLCRMELRDGLVIVVEVIGIRVPREAMRWPVRRGEAAALHDAMVAFVAGDLPSVETYTSHPLPFPFVSVTWSTRVSGALMSGFYFKSGLDLPPPLARVLDAVMPGSACQGATR